MGLLRSPDRQHRLGDVVVKPWWQSKTIWFNLAVLAATFLTDPSNELTTLGIDPRYAERGVAIGNLILRLVSTAQIVWSRTASA